MGLNSFKWVILCSFLVLSCVIKQKEKDHTPQDLRHEKKVFEIYDDLASRDEKTFTSEVKTKDAAGKALTIALDSIEMKVLNLQPEYKNESNITRINADELHHAKVFIHQGLLITHDGLLTVGSDFTVGIYVVDLEGQMYIATTSITRGLDTLRHSSVLNGAPVLAAGEITVVDGLIRSISNESGHYKPTRDEFNEFKLVLKNRRMWEPSFDVRHPAIIQVLKDALSNPNDQVKQASKMCSLSLNNSTHDSRYDPRVRINEVDIIKNTMPADPEIHEILARSLRDESTELRKSAIYALSEIVPTSELVQGALADAIGDEDNTMSFYAFNILKKIKNLSPSVQASLLKRLKSPYFRQRFLTVQLVGEISAPEPELLLAVVECLKDGNKEVRPAAKETLLKIKPTDQATLLAIVQLLEIEDGYLSRETKRAANEILNAINPTDPVVLSAREQAMQSQ